MAQVQDSGVVQEVAEMVAQSRHDFLSVARFTAIVCLFHVPNRHTEILTQVAKVGMAEKHLNLHGMCAVAQHVCGACLA